MLDYHQTALEVEMYSQYFLVIQLKWQQEVKYLSHALE